MKIKPLIAMMALPLSFCFACEDRAGRDTGGGTSPTMPSAGPDARRSARLLMLRRMERVPLAVERRALPGQVERGGGSTSGGAGGGATGGGASTVP